MKDKSVLVIEDNAKNMKLVRHLLKLGGYQVSEASNAEDGIRMAQAQQPDLILMDIQLPGMDGLSATKQIKADQRLKKTPVLALTSYAMQGDSDKCVQAGCSGYITKPIDTRSFLSRLAPFFDASLANQPLQRKPRTNRLSRILIVDDEPMNIKLMCGKLAGQKYELETAHGGQEALTKVSQNPPDLLLLDIMMPDIDGYEVTRRLKADPQTRKIPIILITALDGKDDKEKGLQVGAEEFLTKPVNKAELLARIHSMLTLRQYQTQLSVRSQSEKLLQMDNAEKLKNKKKSGSGKLLIVEDNREDLKLLTAHLRNQPFDIIAAADGEQALRIAGRQKIDIVLLDIMLPRQSGYDVCKKLKETPETKDIQVVIITCLDDLDSRIKGVELGADDYLVKPIEPRELVARVNVLKKKKAYLDELHQHYQRALNTAIIDGLTGLYNHAYFKQYLDLELKRSKREGHCTALLMIDIDNFKQINDSFGHLIGDCVLREISQVMRRCIREIDVAARYGGEEFVIILPYTDTKGAIEVAERIRRTVAKSAIGAKTVDDITNITVSVGGAVYPFDGAEVHDVIRKADTFLYTAKKKGKNRIEFSQQEVKAGVSLLCS